MPEEIKKCPSCNSEKIEKADGGKLIQCLEENCGQCFQLVDKKPKHVSKSVLDALSDRVKKLEGDEEEDDFI